MPIVYTLTNPVTDEIYYVGFTTRSLNARLLGHLVEQAHPTTKLLVNDGIMPKIDIVEEGEDVTLTTESFYIRKYLSQGHPLENRAIANNYQRVDKENKYLKILKNLNNYLALMKC